MTLEHFTYGAAEVRTTVLDDVPWFIATDVCAVLGIGNASDALRRLDSDERTLVSIDSPNGLPVNAINEAGLYTLILGSRKPEARAFKRWVTHEVLPAIRRTGSYGAPTHDRDSMLAMAREVVAQAERADDAVHRALVAEYRLSEIARVLGLQQPTVPLPQRSPRTDPRREAIRRWVADNMERIAEPGTQASLLHAAYAATPEGAGVSRALFGRVLTEMGFPPVKAHGHWARPLRVVGGTDIEELSS